METNKNRIQLETEIEANQIFLIFAARDKEKYIRAHEYGKLSILKAKTHCATANILKAQIQLNQITPLGEIIEQVTGLPFAVIKTTVRTAEIIQARQFYSYFAHLGQRLTAIEAGNQVNIDHSSVNYHIKQVKKKIKTNPQFKAIFNQVRTLFIEYRNNGRIKPIQRPTHPRAHTRKPNNRTHNQQPATSNQLPATSNQLPATRNPQR